MNPWVCCMSASKKKKYLLGETPNNHKENCITIPPNSQFCVWQKVEGRNAGLSSKTSIGHSSYRFRHFTEASRKQSASKETTSVSRTVHAKPRRICVSPQTHGNVNYLHSSCTSHPSLELKFFEAISKCIETRPGYLSVNSIAREGNFKILRREVPKDPQLTLQLRFNKKQSFLP